MTFAFPTRGIVVIRNKIKIESETHISILSYYENKNTFERGNRGAMMIKCQNK